MSVIVEWVRRSGVSSSKEVDFRSSCEEIPKEALIPNMRMIRATATRTRVLMWNNTFPTIFRSGLILPPLPSAYLYLMPMLFSCESLSIWVPYLTGLFMTNCEFGQLPTPPAITSHPSLPSLFSFTSSFLLLECPTTLYSHIVMQTDRGAIL